MKKLLLIIAVAICAAAMCYLCGGNNKEHAPRRFSDVTFSIEQSADKSEFTFKFSDKINPIELYIINVPGDTIVVHELDRKPTDFILVPSDGVAKGVNMFKFKIEGYRDINELYKVKW